MKLFISPPFGNYTGAMAMICRARPNVIPILGSYTLYRRHGLVRQIFRTIRYDNINKGLLNNIGLRNAGIIIGLYRYEKALQILGRAVLSVGITDAEEIPALLKIIPPETNLEFNIACPNLSRGKSINMKQIDKMISFGFGEFVPRPTGCDSQNTGVATPYRIIKMQHNMRLDYVDKLFDCGFRQFHCSNSKPTQAGSLSGQSLRQQNLRKIEELDRRFFGEIEIIGGGGVESRRDIEQYRWAGAEHISVSTACLNPFKFYNLLA